jgi:predicted metal-dependent phosphotriesterase family hydrolase
VPMLLEVGVPGREIDRILTENPARWLDSER